MTRHLPFPPSPLAREERVGGESRTARRPAHPGLKAKAASPSAIQRTELPPGRPDIALRYNQAAPKCLIAMKKASEYREHAGECRKLAAKMETAADREQMLAICDQWEQIARDREREELDAP